MWPGRCFSNIDSHGHTIFYDEAVFRRPESSPKPRCVANARCLASKPDRDSSLFANSPLLTAGTDMPRKATWAHRYASRADYSPSVTIILPSAVAPAEFSTKERPPACLRFRRDKLCVCSYSGKLRRLPAAWRSYTECRGATSTEPIRPWRRLLIFAIALSSSRAPPANTCAASSIDSSGRG